MAQILANLLNKNIFFCLEAKIMLSLCSSFHQEKVQVFYKKVFRFKLNPHRRGL